jgi:4-amino-4-deoxy-L-arabinose transferase-like glycosyltransferase
VSKGPQNSPPPGGPGRAGLARRGIPPEPYRRPVQSPDAETVMLASVKTEADVTPDPDLTPEPGPPPPDAKRSDGEPSGAGASGPGPSAATSSGDGPSGAERPAVPATSAGVAEDEEPGVSTRVLTLPRGKRSGPAQWSAPSARRTWISRAVLALILVVQAALSLRLRNTAFGNEALYLYAGHLEIAHLLHGAPLQGTYASYFPGAPVLYPVLGAVADGLGGLAAARAVSLVAMLATTALLYAMTRRLFNERVALCAAGLFGVTEGAIFAGRLATNDAPSLCLLALASWIVVRTASWRWRAYLLAAPVAGLAVATGYWALLYLPTIALLAGLAAYPYLGRQALARALVLWAVTVELIAAAVIVAGRPYVTAAVSATVGRTPGSAEALHILTEGGKWGGFVLGLAALGAVGYAFEARTEANEHIALPGGRRCRIALGVVLTGTALLAVAVQAYQNTDVSLDTHIGFGLFFAAPMAGVGLARLVGDHFRRAQIGIVVWAAALIVGLSQATQLFGSWPDPSSLVGELTRYLGPGERYLVENDNVAIYYLRGHPDAQPDQFTSTYFISYRTPRGQVLTGTQGFLAAVRYGYFRVIIYDGTVTPALDKALAAALEADPRYRLAGAVPENARDFRATCYVWVRT